MLMTVDVVPPPGSNEDAVELSSVIVMFTPPGGAGSRKKTVAVVEAPVPPAIAGGSSVIPLAIGSLTRSFTIQPLLAANSGMPGTGIVGQPSGGWGAWRGPPTGIVTLNALLV